MQIQVYSKNDSYLICPKDAQAEAWLVRNVGKPLWWGAQEELLGVLEGMERAA